MGHTKKKILLHKICLGCNQLKLIVFTYVVIFVVATVFKIDEEK